jgi:F-box/WD-40 domain protein 7
VRTLVHANNMLFSGSYDKTVRVWDTQTLECRATLTGHSGAVRALVSSARYVFSGSDDTTIKVRGRGSWPGLGLGVGGPAGPVPLHGRDAAGAWTRPGRLAGCVRARP